MTPKSKQHGPRVVIKTRGGCGAYGTKVTPSQSPHESTPRWRGGGVKGEDEKAPRLQT